MTKNKIIAFTVLLVMAAILSVAALNRDPDTKTVSTGSPLPARNDTVPAIATTTP